MSSHPNSMVPDRASRFKNTQKASEGQEKLEKRRNSTQQSPGLGAQYELNRLDGDSILKLYLIQTQRIPEVAEIHLAEGTVADTVNAWIVVNEESFDARDKIHSTEYDIVQLIPDGDIDARVVVRDLTPDLPQIPEGARKVFDRAEGTSSHGFPSGAREPGREEQTAR